MTVLDSPPPLNRNQSLLRSSSSNNNPSSRKRFTEVAGGATAECAAVTCCCPCSVLNLLVLVMYKVPAGLFRKALRHKRRRRIMKKEGLLPAPGLGKGNGKEVEICTVLSGDSVMMVKAMEKNDDVMEVLGKDDGMMKLEKEMWEQFYQTGFWRSPSQRLVTFGR